MADRPVPAGGLGYGFVPVRDSKTPTGPVLFVAPSAWAAFVEGIQHSTS
ncbi:DUF397 domain-containing protein [Streptomyces sp. NBC_01635]|nr:DUF397 domain-containing protein [Streptomyces sp. NBC_01635]